MMINSLVKNVLSAIGVVCLFALSANAQYEYVFKLPFQQHFRVVDSLLRPETDSVHFSQMSDQLLRNARATGDGRDELIVQASILGWDGIWTKDISHFEEKCLALIEKAAKMHYPPVIAYCHVLLGNYHYGIRKNYVRAFEYFEHYIKECDDYYGSYKNELARITYSNYIIAFANYKFYDYKKALKYSKNILSAGYIINDLEDVLVNDLIGMSYIKLHQYDSSLVYFQKTLDAAGKSKEQAVAGPWKGIVTGNIGLAYYLQKKYDMAIPYLLEGEKLCKQNNVADNVASFATYLANIYISQKNMPAAQEQLNIAREAAQKSADLQNSYDLYSTTSNFYRQQGNAALTLQYLDSSLKFKDSLVAISDVTQKNSAEIAVADERRIMQEQLIEKEKQKQILIRNGSIVLTLMVLIYVLLFYNRKLLKQKLRREQLLAEKQRTELELDNARRLLDDFTRNITEKNELIESLKERTNEHIDTGVLAKLQQSTLVTDDQWEEFRTLFDKLHAGYLFRLKEKMPGLTPAETRFVVLSKLKLSNKEMSAMLGNSPDAIRQYRSRLRKKFNIPENQSIEELAEAV